MMKRPECQLFFSASPLPRHSEADPPTSGVASKRAVGPSQTSSGVTGNSPTVNARRIEYLQEQMKINSQRDRHLWMIVIVVILVLLVGLAGLLAPSLVWKTMSFHLDFRYLPQLFWGMIALVALFSIYATTQKREVSATRSALVQELIISEHMQAFSLLDPITQLLNACAIDNITYREIARANRLGSALTFAAITLDNLSAIKERLGVEGSEQALFHAARLLKNTFRGSDAIFRTGPAEFLVVMPDTAEPQAESALSRLKASTERWNADTETGLELSFSYGVSPHFAGGSSAEAIERAQRCMVLSSQKVNLVF